jgi:hypothetical protein
MQSLKRSNAQSRSTFLRTRCLAKAQALLRVFEIWGRGRSLEISPGKGAPFSGVASRSLLFNRPRNKPAASVPFNCDRVLRQLFPLLRQVQVQLPDVGSGAARAARWYSTAFLRQPSAFAVAHSFHSVAFANELNRPCPPAFVRLTPLSASTPGQTHYFKGSQRLIGRASRCSNHSAPPVGVGAPLSVMTRPDRHRSTIQRDREESA